MFTNLKIIIIIITFRAEVPAYCLLIVSPLLAHIICNLTRHSWGRVCSGGIIPSFANWFSNTVLPRAVWNEYKKKVSG